jgi:23S rRNA (uracil1939-C5)-methyltransferase
VSVILPSRAGDNPVELEVDRLANEGAGVARVEGHVFFVSGAAPGDRVRARVTRRRKRLVEAEVVEVLRPGPARICAPCPVAARCGGCDWQHVAYDAQIEAKHSIVVDSLERLGKFASPPVAPVLPSPATYGYRNRIRLHYENSRLCYYERSSRRPVPVTDCLIADDRVRGSLASVHELLAALETAVREVEVASRLELDGVVVSLASRGRLRAADGRTIPHFLRSAGHSIVGVTMHGPHWHRSWGDTRRRFVVDAPPIAIDGIDASCGQVNEAANRILVETVLQVAALRGDERVWDLYAGAGNLTLPLARRASEVVSVERDAGAVAAARSAAAAHQIVNVSFHARDVEAWLGSAGATPDLVVANPPRSGLGDATATLAALRPARIVYVSCNPATLARDCVVLRECGYTLAQVRPVDLFPQTCRVESVCEAVLT